MTWLLEFVGSVVHTERAARASALARRMATHTHKKQTEYHTLNSIYKLHSARARRPCKLYAFNKSTRDWRCGAGGCCRRESISRLYTAATDIGNLGCRTNEKRDMIEISTPTHTTTHADNPVHLHLFDLATRLGSRTLTHRVSHDETICVMCASNTSLSLAARFSCHSTRLTTCNANIYRRVCTCF